MTKIHRLRFNEQKEGKKDKNGINTSAFSALLFIVSQCKKFVTWAEERHVL